eukprot:888929-Rhodomonas_salina.1
MCIRDSSGGGGIRRASCPQRQAYGLSVYGDSALSAYGLTRYPSTPTAYRYLNDLWSRKVAADSTKRGTDSAYGATRGSQIGARSNQ